MAYSYERTTWNAGDAITSIRMNNIEEGIVHAYQELSNEVSILNSSISDQARDLSREIDIVDGKLGSGITGSSTVAS